jgi:hypothetical protein
MDTDEQPEIPPEISPPLASPGMLGRARSLLIDLSPLRGDVEAGAVASIFNLLVAIVSGGLLCIAGVAVLAARVPQFARYDAKNPTP